MPMTAPLRNATRKARSSECFAPAAVRFDALVAVLMPNQPARALRIPPVRKTNGTSGGNTCSPQASTASRPPSTISTQPLQIQLTKGLM